MSFSADFLKHFTDEEKESEIVKLYCIQGDNMELALKQELTKQALSYTELLRFPESLLRSWLAALFIPIENYTAATGTISVKVESATGQVTLSKGSLINCSGVIYTQTADVTASPGQTVQVPVKQGQPGVKPEAEYSDYLTLAAEGLDFSELVVRDGNTVISPCGRTSAGITPEDGYYAFTYNNQLYVKIYPGEHTPAPLSTSKYTLEFWTCQGKAGNIVQNSVTGYVDTIYDRNGQEAVLSFTNPAILNGKNAPSKADLVNKLRYWFFVKDSVSSLTEYRLWFLNQSGIGDVLVEGDYERYLKSLTGQFEITGSVFITALDNDARPITETYQNELRALIAPYKDMAWLQFTNPKAVENFIEVRYQGSDDEAAFVDLVRKVLNAYYDLATLKEYDLSLFGDLDFDVVRQSIGTQYNPVGLQFIPYHQFVQEVEANSSYANLDCPLKGESDQGYYELRRRDSSTSTGWALKPFALLRQFPDSQTDTNHLVKIYCEYCNEAGLVADAYCGEKNTETNLVRLELPFAFDVQITARWAIKEPGVLPVGTPSGYRVLSGMEIKLVQGA